MQGQEHQQVGQDLQDGPGKLPAVRSSRNRRAKLMKMPKAMTMAGAAAYRFRLSMGRVY